jgi:hypothetical protein
MNLEGFKLLAIVVVDGHPPPIVLSLLLGIENGVLANSKTRPAKANVLVGCVTSGPLRYFLLLGHDGGGHAVHRHVFRNISVVVAVLAVGAVGVVRDTSMESALQSGTATGSISNRRGFSPRLERNFAGSGGRGSGLDATIRIHGDAFRIQIWAIFTSP